MTDHHNADHPFDSIPQDEELERALADWGRRERRRDLPGGDLGDRIFAASRGLLVARRAEASPPPTPGRSPLRATRSGSMWQSPLPARVALAAGLLGALLVPAALDVHDARNGAVDEGPAALASFDETSLDGASSAEPLLLAFIEPGTATWEDVAGYGPGVDLYSVLESGRAGLDDYLTELDAIFGTLDGAGEEM